MLLPQFEGDASIKRCSPKVRRKLPEEPKPWRGRVGAEFKNLAAASIFLDLPKPVADRLDRAGTV